MNKTILIDNGDDILAEDKDKMIKIIISKITSHIEKFCEDK